MMYEIKAEYSLIFKIWYNTQNKFFSNSVPKMLFRLFTSVELHKSKKYNNM